MLLPTDQYVLMPLPNGAKLEKKSDNLFNLIVPELQIFSVWLRPHVVSRVDVTPAGVIIEAVECRLDGRSVLVISGIVLYRTLLSTKVSFNDDYHRILPH
jgi:hypothetical protein